MQGSDTPQSPPGGVRARLSQDAAHSAVARAVEEAPEVTQQIPVIVAPTAEQAPRAVRSAALAPPPVAPSPVAPSPRMPRFRVPVTPRLILRVVYAVLCLGLLVGAWAVSRGGPLAGLGAAPTATPAATVRPLPGGLILGYQDTPTVPSLVATPVPPTAPATLTPLPTAPPTAFPLGASASPVAGGSRLVLQDSNFTGGVPPPAGLYRGRSALELLGQSDPGPQSSIATARFNLDSTTASPIRTASLTLVGLDSAEPAAPLLRVALNEQEIFRGPDPLPNDFPATQAGAGNWGSYTWPLDAGALLQGANVLTLTNLDAGASLGVIVVDYVEIAWGP